MKRSTCVADYISFSKKVVLFNHSLRFLPFSHTFMIDSKNEMYENNILNRNFDFEASSIDLNQNNL